MTPSRRWSSARSRVAAIVALAVLAVATTVGCSASSPASDAADAPAATGAPAGKTGQRPPEPEPRPQLQPQLFTGADDDFYEVPDPLPHGEPGDLIRVQALGEADGRVNVKIMYHSRDAEDRDRAVTGVATYPTEAAPDGGWPVISTAHGTTGIASRCAPSRTQRTAPGWGVDSVSVMTDYIGLGPIGEVHPYLSKPSEGNAVIDAVRAVGQIPDAHASSRWLAIGHSQGGHGALAAAELSHDYAPELELLGTVALAPAAMLDRVYGGIDPIVTNVLTMMGLYGATSEHPDLDVTDYVTPEADEASSIFETGCLAEITDALVPIAMAGPFTADPRQTEPARSVLLANDVGLVAVPGAPLFLASGTIDDRVVIDRVRDLYDRLCTTGQVTELVIVEGADHGGIVPATSAQVTAFLQDRLAGLEPVDSCATR
jgi:hypothetical protein